jgi:hypothetical protein
MPQRRGNFAVDEIVERRLAMSEGAWRKLWPLAIRTHRSRGEVVSEMIEEAYKDWVREELRRLKRDETKRLHRLPTAAR